MNPLKKLLKQPFFLVAVFYLLSVSIINPLGEFAINDDWDFFTHVRNFRQLDFVKNSLIDSSFILQGFVGAIWSLVFGLSFTSLRFLTMLVTMVFLFGVEKILELYEPNKKTRLLTLALILFNPFVFIASISFMTEIYFLCLIIWSVYLTLLYVKTKNNKYRLLAIILASLSILVRQIGLLFGPTLLVIMWLLDFYQVKSPNFKKIRATKYIVYLVILFGIALISLFWPQYNADNEKPLDLIVTAIISLGDFSRIVHDLFFLIPYIGLSILPLGLYSFSLLAKKYKFLVAVAVLGLFATFYKFDLFKLGNTLYPEGLMIKSNYISHLTLFDNNLFKSFLTIVCLTSFFGGIGYLATKIKSFLKPELIILGTLFMALTFPIVIYTGFYDRYLVNGMVLLVILLSLVLPKPKTKLSNITLVLFILLIVCYTVCLTQDFISTTRVQWEQASILKREKNVTEGIFLNNTYTKFNYVFSKPNNESLADAMPSFITYKCYVQKKVYEPTDNNLLHTILNRLNTSATVNKFFTNPKPYEGTKLPGFREPTNDLKKIIYSEEIFSFQENVIGNKVFIITYCN